MTWNKEKTDRLHPLATKVREDFYWRLKELALKEKCKIVELIERAVKIMLKGGGEREKERVIFLYCKALAWHSKTPPKVPHFTEWFWPLFLSVSVNRYKRSSLKKVFLGNYPSPIFTPPPPPNHHD